MPTISASQRVLAFLPEDEWLSIDEITARMEVDDASAIGKAVRTLHKNGLVEREEGQPETRHHGGGPRRYYWRKSAAVTA